MTQQHAFPFIVGAGRSGTTLLRAMLDSHPELAIPGETYLVAQLARRRDGFIKSGTFDRERFEVELFGDSRFWAFYVTPEDVRAVLDEVQPADLADALRATYEAYARRVGKSRYGDKTPSYAFATERIGPLFPESVFIHIHRDPREVVASYLDVDWGPSNVHRAAALWTLSIRAARSARRFGEARFLECSYSELVAEPERTMRKICSLSQLEFAPQMLEYQKGRVAAISYGMEGGAHVALQQAPRRRRDWRNDLTKDQVATIESIALSEMLYLGYEPVSSRGAHDRTLAQRMTEPAALLSSRAELSLRHSRALNSLRPYVRKARGDGAAIESDKLNAILDAK